MLLIPMEFAHVGAGPADLIGHLPLRRGRELGLSGHEVAGAPDGVPPLSPTMSLTPSRTPHPSQLGPSPFAAPLPQLAPFASRTSRHTYSLLPAPSIVQPTPLPSPSPPRRIIPARRQDILGIVNHYLETIANPETGEI